MSTREISIPRPDDWHVHLRDGAMLKAVLEATASVFARAIVMPNLRPAVTTSAAALAYRRRIIEHLSPRMSFEPLMTCYLADATDPLDLRAGFNDGVLTAAKLYPAGATTNSEAGVTDILALDPVLVEMQALGMPLLLHGEVVDADVDIFDREAVFIDRTLSVLVERYPDLRIVLEHLTSAQGVEFVRAQNENVAATITPHHLMINRNAMFKGGMRPHYYCLPVAKRERHRLALRAAATSGNPKFFLGTDSAPHCDRDKESACGCAGVYNAPTAMACYAQVFDEEGQLERLAGFAAHHGADFYRLARNTERVHLVRETVASPQPVTIGSDVVTPFVPDEPLLWHLQV